jgi:hypothetical protein
MARVVTRDYSTHLDLRTNVQFGAVLVQALDDPSFGCFVGQAQVGDEQAAAFAGRRGFEVLSEAEYAALTQAMRDTEPGRAARGEDDGEGPPSPPSK